MALDGKTFQQIHDALLDSFFNKVDLAQMVKRELGEDLEHIAGGENFKEVTFNLLRWAETQDKVDLLLKNACEYNPTNRSLRAALQQLTGTTDLSSPPLDESRMATVLEPTRRNIVPRVGLAILLLFLLAFTGKLILGRVSSQNTLRQPLTEEQRKTMREFLDLARDALQYDSKDHLDMANHFVIQAETISSDDQEVKELRSIVDKRKK